MVWTVPKVEINIQNSLHGLDNWIDVTADVRGTITISTGRQSELDQYSAATCSFTLDNRTRNYDFTNASGPYFGKLIPRNEVRITATYLSVTYSLFFGRVQGWPQQYDNMNQTSFVTLNAIDGFDIWSQKRWSGHPYPTMLQSLAPRMWFRLTSEGDQGVAGPSEDENHFAYDFFGRYLMQFSEGAFSNENTSGPVQADARTENSGRVARFENRGWARVYAEPLPALPNTWAAGLWFRALPKSYHTVGGSNDAGIFSFGQSVRVAIAWDANGFGRLTIQRKEVSSSFVLGFTGPIVADGKWHHLVMLHGTDFRYFVDGVKIGVSTNFAGHNYDDVASLIIGRNFDLDTSQPLNGWIHDFWTFGTYAPSDTVVSDLYSAATNWQNQNTSQRLQSILSVFIQDLIVQDVDNGLMRIAPIKKSLDGNMLETMQQVALVEGGHLFIKPDGALAFRRKNTPLTATRSTTTQATFGDSGSDIRYTEATPTLDLQFMYNEATVTRDLGGSYIAKDFNSLDAYESRSRDLGPLPFANDNDAIAQTQWIVDLYGQPKARLPYVKFSARYSSAAMIYALDSRLLDRIVIKRLPVGGGSQWTFTTHVESKVTEINLDALEWNVLFTLTQNSVVSGYLALDGATVDSQLNAGVLGV